jgi:two-component system sensor histidine kinase/response regulator
MNTEKSFETLNQQIKKRVYFVMLFVTLLVVASSLIIFKNQYNTVLAQEKSEADKNLMIIEQFISDEINLVTQDLEFFSRNPAYANFIMGNEIPHRKAIVNTLKTYGEIREMYLGVSLLDLAGNQKMDINFINGKAKEVKTPSLKLSSIADDKMTSLNKKDVLVGSIDLFRLNGEIAIPPQATVGFVTPIYHSGQKLGYVVIHYKAQRLLDKLYNLETGSDFRFLLSNASGYWIKGQNKLDGFSFLLTPNNPKGPKFQYTKIWDVVTQAESGFLNSVEGPLSYKKIAFKDYLKKDPSYNINESDYFYISSLMPYRFLASRVTELRISLIINAFLILLLVLPVIFWLHKQIEKGNKYIIRSNVNLDAQNKELETKKQQLEQSISAYRTANREREDYLKRLENKDADLKVAQEIAQLAYYNRNVLTNESEWSENMPSVFGLPQHYDFNNGNNLRSVIHPDDYERCVRLWQEAISKKETFKMVYRIFNSEGGIEHLQDTAKPVLEGRHLKYMQGTIQNISERIRVEQALREAKEKAEQATKAKSNFLATMSHEIRTPLNAVLGMANLLQTTPLNERQKDFVSTIVSSGDSLLSVINDVLDFSRIESGRMTFEKKWFDLNTLLEDAMMVVCGSASAKNILLFYSLHRDVPNQIEGDENRIRQALINLLNNAIKFTEKGSVSIKVSVLNKTRDSIQLKFEVQDTGIGISKENQPSVFNAFQQADSSIARVYGGSGLGLSITKKLIRAMKGSIGLESKLGQGSLFHFKLSFAYKQKVMALPSTEALSLVAKKTEEVEAIRGLLAYGAIAHELIGLTDALEPKSKPVNNKVLIVSELHSREKLIELAVSYAKQGKEVHLLSNLKRKPTRLEKVDIVNRPMRLKRLQGIITNEEAQIIAPKLTTKASLDISILVAEDNPVNQKLSRLVFEKLGYDIDMAENGAEAISMSEQKSYDLIFMDIQMPKTDGIQATTAIRKNKAISKQPIIIALTANALEGQKDFYLKAGMDDYLAKPMDFEALSRMLEKYSKASV